MTMTAKDDDVDARNLSTSSPEELVLVFLLRFELPSSPRGLCRRLPPRPSAGSSICPTCSVWRYWSIGPFAAAVTFAMNALCFAANSGFLSREERPPSLMSDLGDSDPVGVGGPSSLLLRLFLVRGSPWSCMLLQ